MSRPIFRMRSVLLLLIGTVGALSPLRADDLSRKGDLFLQPAALGHGSAVPTSVIVRLKDGPTAFQIRRLQELGGQIYLPLPLIHAVALRVPQAGLARLAALPFVQRLSLDVTVQKCDEFTVGSSLDDVAVTQTGLSGRGVGVAVLDSGVHGGADLGGGSGSRIAANVSFVPGDSSPDDANGHGTHVAGIVAGNGAGSTGPNDFRTFYGIARQANVINVRVLDAQGQTAVSTAIAGIQWVVAHKRADNIRVLNLSLGHPVGESYTTDPLCQAVEAAWKAGIVVVCAAGNGGRLLNAQLPLLGNEGWGTSYGSVTSPGNDPYVITVGATKSVDGSRPHDQIATYSGRGPSRLDFVLKPDLIAPGNRVISLDSPGSTLATTYGATNGVPWSQFATTGTAADSAKYFTLSGTSMATPVVAGAAALLLQQDPTLTPDTVKARLMFSADKWAAPNGAGDPCTYGAGYLDIPAALTSRLTARQYAQSPSLTRGLLSGVYVVLGPAFETGGSIWGTGVSNLQSLLGPVGIGGSGIGGSMILWGESVWTDNSTFSVPNLGLDLSPVVTRGDASG